MRKHLILLFALLVLTPGLWAELRLPAIIGDHMVLQQQQSNPVWGWDTPGAKVTVTFAGQSQTATAGADGKWTVKLPPLSANTEPRTLDIAGTTRREVRDVLVGEVWLCSGQSNMAFTLKDEANGELETATADLPQIRLLAIPRRGTQDVQDDFTGAWRQCATDTAGKFSAVGFYFGRYLQQVLRVPVGLIDASWGSSAAESWVRRSALEQEPRFHALIARTVSKEAEMRTPEAAAHHVAAMAKWKQDKPETQPAGRPAPRPPQSPAAWLAGQQRAGNIFAGMLHPIIGYGIKGVIWYQGESNSSDEQVGEYGELFPFLIQQWRKEWGQGNFPFYWVQLANFRERPVSPGGSNWALVREAQTRTLRLPKTGQAVIIDLGESRNIHPRNKRDVAARLVRWALANDYGVAMAFRSPEFKSCSIQGKKALVTFDVFGSSLRTFDVREVKGFAVCGADKIWHWADARIKGRDQVEVWSQAVAAPVAVRYAWADNPACNLQSETGLPATPFRTDDFDATSRPKVPASGPVRPIGAATSTQSLPSRSSPSVRDLWRRTDVAVSGDACSADDALHGVALVQIASAPTRSRLERLCCDEA